MYPPRSHMALPQCSISHLGNAKSPVVQSLALSEGSGMPKCTLQAPIRATLSETSRGTSTSWPPKLKSREKDGSDLRLKTSLEQRT